VLLEKIYWGGGKKKSHKEVASRRNKNLPLGRGKKRDSVKKIHNQGSLISSYVIKGRKQKKEFQKGKGNITGESAYSGKQ